METFNIDNFNPTTAKLIEFIGNYRGLTIAKDGLEKVKEAKKNLQGQRTFITRTLKLDRDKAIQYQKANISKEKELVGIIKEVEDILDMEIEKQQQEEEMAKRLESLPIRKDELKAIGLENDYDDEFILSMDFTQFMAFITSEKARLYEEEQEKKRQKEAEEKRLADLKEAEERGRLQAEAKAKEEADRKEKERKELEERKAREQLELQERAKQEEAKKIAKEKAEQERLEKAEKYRGWLAYNGYTEDNKEEHLIQKENGKVILYKKISEFII